MSRSRRHRNQPGRAAATILAALALLATGCGVNVVSKGDHKLPKPPRTGKLTPPGKAGRNAARIAGTSPSDVAGAAILAAYPESGHPPSGFVLTQRRSWQQSLVAAQFAAHPVNAAVLPIEHDFLPTASKDMLQRLVPPGFPRAKGLQAVVLGGAGDDVFLALQQHKLKLTLLKGSTPAELALASVPFRGGWAAAYSSQVLIVSSERRDFALPAAAWSAYSGDTVTFVTHDSIPDATRKLLVQRQKLRLDKPSIYLLGPSDVISDSVEQQLGAYGAVKRIAGTTPEENAVAFARYRDPTTGFGWGLDQGPASVSLVNLANWGNAFGAVALAAAGPQAPLLLTSSSSSLPPAVLAYLRQLRGPVPNQGFVFGNEHSISSSVLDELDRDLEPGPSAPPGP